MAGSALRRAVGGRVLPAGATDHVYIDVFVNVANQSPSTAGMAGPPQKACMKRGDVVRMDIMTDFDVSGIPDYDTWASSFFGVPTGDGARIAAK